MRFTLAELLKTGNIPGVEMLTRSVDPEDVSIDSVSVQELPVEDFVRRNELVLSTAIGCMKDENKFEELIRGISASHAAALFLAFSDPSYRVPGRLVSLADSLDLPMFSIPWEYRFSDIQEQVFLSLWLNSQNVEDIVSSRIKDDFVWNLANGNYESLSDMARQGLKLHFDLGKPYTCIAIRAVPRDGESASGSYSLRTAAVSLNAENALIKEAGKLNLAVMVAARNTDITGFLENGKARPEKDVEGYIDAVRERLARDCPSHDFYFGISETNTKRPVFDALYRNASVALQYCLNSSRKQYRFTYRDTREAQVVSALSASEAVKKIAGEVLGPLREYDASSDIDLMGTLIEYIRNNYNMSLTARKLNIHRQSLLYRLEKIEALTEMSLDDHQDLFLLEVSTRMYYHY
ncbi:MAG: PucR family transcriptional regulator ligand-binding domain-containing protein [Firmicutes bacterium]|nr:PucR family transcriptional regulator ligand-binding domain-containing protein [Bacillota bacterium]